MSRCALIPRPDPDWKTVSSRLTDLTVVTWAVEPARLRPHVPDGFTLELLDGSALISAVTFYNTTFRPYWLPIGLSLGQTNYRVYVQRQGRRGVFFIGTTIDTAFVGVPRYLWQMPWRRARYRFSPGAVEATGEWPMSLRYVVGEPVGALPGFSTLGDGLTILTQPWEGYYQGDDQKIGRYTIWHAPYAPRTATALEVRYGLLDALDIVPLAAQGQVHSVLAEAETLYHVHLPPRWLSDGTPRTV
ncbi:MAG: DUF2071 domain-containing protein [Myxococcota bacterium]|nr:DUF2071 domain-containing protein [Myxococcota bacterium]